MVRDFEPLKQLVRIQYATLVNEKYLVKMEESMLYVPQVPRPRLVTAKY